MCSASIVFPHLGITLTNVGRFIDIGDFQIAYYGIVIAFAMFLAVNLICFLAKKSGQSEDRYLTLCMIVLTCSVIGARLYYVIFSWDYYSGHPKEIFDIRGGGLAIYGGILTGIAVTAILARCWKMKVWQILDIMMPAVALGQAIGRWGNFFNREAFGNYTDSLFAMALPRTAVYPQDITEKMLEHPLILDGIEFIQVHPTFLYESLWNVGLFTTLLYFFSKKRFDGEIFWLYLGGYGFGRFFIESIRTDQLMIPGTQIPVSMVVAGTMVLLSIFMLILKFTIFCDGKKKNNNI